MKITGIETYCVWAKWCNWYFVKVNTDSGLWGWGEGSLHGQVEAVDTAVREVSAVLVGHEFDGVEVSWQRMYHAWRWRGGAVSNTAVGALDTALWDLEGKRLDVPLHRLLGGALRADLPAYSSHWLYNSTDPDVAAAEAKKAVADGYIGLKWALGRVWDNRDVSSSISRSEEIISAAREGAGPGARIFIDCSEQLTADSARRLSRALQQYDIGWYEEPLPFENAKAMAQLSKDVGLPVATGERLLSRWEFRELLEAGACIAIQPDIMHAAGVSEVRKIAIVADSYYVPVAPHNPAGPVSTAAAVQLGLSLPNFLVLETMDDERDLRDAICTTPLPFENGRFLTPAGPGLGVELDVDALEAMSFQPQPPGQAPRLWLG